MALVVSTMSVRRSDDGGPVSYEVALRVSDGESYGRQVSGSAIIDVTHPNGERIYRLYGTSLDMWLSGGVIAMLDEYSEQVRREAIDEIERLAVDAARAYDEERGV